MLLRIADKLYSPDHITYVDLQYDGGKCVRVDLDGETYHFTGDDAIALREHFALPAQSLTVKRTPPPAPKPAPATPIVTPVVAPAKP